MNLAMPHLPTKPGCPARAARPVSVAATTGTQVGHYAYIGLGYAANASILGKSPDAGEVGGATTDPFNFADAERHSQGANYLFSDGHVKWRHVTDWESGATNGLWNIP